MLGRSVTVFALAFSLFAGSAFSGDSSWMTDYKAALEKAASEKKPVLLEFTGSDWCPPCQMLASETLSSAEFKDMAAKNLVLVELDFPQTKDQPQELASQNEGLAKEYKVEGFPTLILLDASGKELSRQVGYMPKDEVLKWITETTKS